MVFRLAAPAVDILVKDTGVADLQVGDDEACVGPFRAGLHTGDDPLDAAPAGGPVEELLEAARLAFRRRGLEARLRARPSMCRRNVVVGATPRIYSRPLARHQSMTSGQQYWLSARSYIWVLGQLVRIARSRRRRKVRISLPPGRLAGRSTAVTKRPSPSNTTIG